jgi:hypothetical protein
MNRAHSLRWRADFGVALTLFDAPIAALDRRDAGKFQKKQVKTHNSCG